MKFGILINPDKPTSRVGAGVDSLAVLNKTPFYNKNMWYVDFRNILINFPGRILSRRDLLYASLWLVNNKPNDDSLGFPPLLSTPTYSGRFIRTTRVIPGQVHHTNCSKTKRTLAGRTSKYVLYPNDYRHMHRFYRPRRVFSPKKIRFPTFAVSGGLTRYIPSKQLHRNMDRKRNNKVRRLGQRYMQYNLRQKEHTPGYIKNRGILRAVNASNRTEFIRNRTGMRFYPDYFTFPKFKFLAREFNVVSGFTFFSKSKKKRNQRVFFGSPFRVASRALSSVGSYGYFFTQYKRAGYRPLRGMKSQWSRGSGTTNWRTLWTKERTIIKLKVLKRFGSKRHMRGNRESFGNPLIGHSAWKSRGAPRYRHTDRAFLSRQRVAMYIGDAVRDHRDKFVRFFLYEWEFITIVPDLGFHSEYYYGDFGMQKYAHMRLRSMRLYARRWISPRNQGLALTGRFMSLYMRQLKFFIGRSAIAALNKNITALNAPIGVNDYYALTEKKEFFLARLIYIIYNRVYSAIGGLFLNRFMASAAFAFRRHKFNTRRNFMRELSSSAYSSLFGVSRGVGGSSSYAYDDVRVFSVGGSLAYLRRQFFSWGGSGFRGWLSVNKTDTVLFPHERERSKNSRYYRRRRNPNIFRKYARLSKPGLRIPSRVFSETLADSGYSGVRELSRARSTYTRVIRQYDTTMSDRRAWAEYRLRHLTERHLSFNIGGHNNLNSRHAVSSDFDYRGKATLSVYSERGVNQNRRKFSRRTRMKVRNIRASRMQPMRKQYARGYQSGIQQNARLVKREEKYFGFTPRLAHRKHGVMFREDHVRIPVIHDAMFLRIAPDYNVVPGFDFISRKYGYSLGTMLGTESVVTHSLVDSLQDSCVNRLPKKNSSRQTAGMSLYNRVARVTKTSDTFHRKFVADWGGFSFEECFALAVLRTGVNRQAARLLRSNRLSQNAIKAIFLRVFHTEFTTNERRYTFRKDLDYNQKVELAQRVGDLLGVWQRSGVATRFRRSGDWFEPGFAETLIATLPDRVHNILKYFLYNYLRKTYPSIDVAKYTVWDCAPLGFPESFTYQERPTVFWHKENFKKPIEHAPDSLAFLDKFIATDIDHVSRVIWVSFKGNCLETLPKLVRGLVTGDNLKQRNPSAAYHAIGRGRHFQRYLRVGHRLPEHYTPIVPPGRHFLSQSRALLTRSRKTVKNRIVIFAGHCIPQKSGLRHVRLRSVLRREYSGSRFPALKTSPSVYIYAETAVRAYSVEYNRVYEIVGGSCTLNQPLTPLVPYVRTPQTVRNYGVRFGFFFTKHGTRLVFSLKLPTCFRAEFITNFGKPRTYRLGQVFVEDAFSIETEKGSTTIATASMPTTWIPLVVPTTVKVHAYAGFFTKEKRIPPLGDSRVVPVLGATSKYSLVYGSNKVRESTGCFFRVIKKILKIKKRGSVRVPSPYTQYRKSRIRCCVVATYKYRGGIVKRYRRYLKPAPRFASEYIKKRWWSICRGRTTLSPGYTYRKRVILRSKARGRFAHQPYGTYTWKERLTHMVMYSGLLMHKRAGVDLDNVVIWSKNMVGGFELIRPHPHEKSENKILEDRWRPLKSRKLVSASVSELLSIPEFSINLLPNHEEYRTVLGGGFFKRVTSPENYIRSVLGFRLYPTIPEGVTEPGGRIYERPVSVSFTVPSIAKTRVGFDSLKQHPEVFGGSSWGSFNLRSVGSLMSSIRSAAIYNFSALYSAGSHVSRSILSPIDRILSLRDLWWTKKHLQLILYRLPHLRSINRIRTRFRFTMRRARKFGIGEFGAFFMACMSHTVFMASTSFSHFFRLTHMRHTNFAAIASRGSHRSSAAPGTGDNTHAQFFFTSMVWPKLGTPAHATRALPLQEPYYARIGWGLGVSPRNSDFTSRNTVRRWLRRFWYKQYYRIRLFKRATFGYRTLDGLFRFYIRNDFHYHTRQGGSWKFQKTGGPFTITRETRPMGPLDRTYRWCYMVFGFFVGKYIENFSTAWFMGGWGEQLTAPYHQDMGRMTDHRWYRFTSVFLRIRRARRLRQRTNKFWHSSPFSPPASVTGLFNKFIITGHATEAAGYSGLFFYVLTGYNVLRSYVRWLLPLYRQYVFNFIVDYARCFTEHYFRWRFWFTDLIYFRDILTIFLVIRESHLKKGIYAIYEAIFTFTRRLIFGKKKKRHKLFANTRIIKKLSIPFFFEWNVRWLLKKPKPVVVFRYYLVSFLKYAEIRFLKEFFWLKIHNRTPNLFNSVVRHLGLFWRLRQTPYLPHMFIYVKARLVYSAIQACFDVYTEEASRFRDVFKKSIDIASSFHQYHTYALLAYADSLRLVPYELTESIILFINVFIILFRIGF